MERFIEESLHFCLQWLRERSRWFFKDVSFSHYPIKKDTWILPILLGPAYLVPSKRFEPNIWTRSGSVKGVRVRTAEAIWLSGLGLQSVRMSSSSCLEKVKWPPSLRDSLEIRAWSWGKMCQPFSKSCHMSRKSLLCPKGRASKVFLSLLYT